ncbi:hypothetical protein ABR737_03380 [Streptomyces sp. Edi2]|uniref:hypothetical protein n=1 Tax=Streptomyces TaxID=1883 RepID=UPI0033068819
MLYREGEVNCGHCREPQGIAVDDYNGETHEDGDVTFTREPCMRCRVHSFGVQERCDDDCPDCEDRGDGLGDAAED